MHEERALPDSWALSSRPSTKRWTPIVGQTRPRGERPYLAGVLGVVVLGTLALVPVLALVSAFASLLGFGAVIVLALRVLRGGATVRPVVPAAAPSAG